MDNKNNAAEELDFEVTWDSDDDNDTERCLIIPEEPTLVAPELAWMAKGVVAGTEAAEKGKLTSSGDLLAAAHRAQPRLKGKNRQAFDDGFVAAAKSAAGL